MNISSFRFSFSVSWAKAQKHHDDVECNQGDGGGKMVVFLAAAAAEVMY